LTGEGGLSDSLNIFPGNWSVKTQELLRAFELSFRQQWDPTAFRWEELDASNFDERHRFAQAYWFAKLAFFEKSGIGAFGLGMVKAAELNLEDPAKKALASITYDQCRHDEVCRRACSRLCPGFPYEYKPRNDLEERALQNILAIYEDGKRYWKGFLQAWQRYRPEMVYGGFFFAEIGAELIFSEMRDKSRLGIYREAFTNIARDESRHLLGTLALMKMAAGKLDDNERLQLTRLLKQGFIFLSPLLYKPQRQFWRLPSHFEEVDEKMEELAYEAGLGTLKLEEKVEAWRRAIEKKRPVIEEVGLQLPSIPELGIEGVPVAVKPDERILGTF
jgi:hypothetical protein